MNSECHIEHFFVATSYELRQVKLNWHLHSRLHRRLAVGLNPLKADRYQNRGVNKALVIDTSHLRSLVVAEFAHYIR